MTDDHQLLREYAAARSESAFRELVGRHIDLVYAAALRLVMGDTHLAEDITQSVFATLAIKAGSIPRDVRLAGWLYRHTCFTASKAVRTEQRRRIREQAATEMNAPADQTGSPWEQVAPHLDEALDELNAADRDAVMLHYLERQNFRSVGLTLGISENAATKRVGRALDRLRVLLAERGIVLTAPVLGPVLLAGTAVSAPAELVASVTAASLANAAVCGGVAVTTTKVIMMTKLQLGVAGALIMAGATAPLLWQQHSFDRLRDENAVLQEEISLLQQESRPVARAEALQAPLDSLDPSERSELLRLRGEMGRLRQESADLQRQSQPPTIAGRTGQPPNAGPQEEPPRRWSFESNELFMAARSGDVETVKRLLNAEPERLNELVGGMRATHLHIAAYDGRAEVVKELLSRKAEVNIQTRFGHTPLFDCVNNRGTVEIAAMLLEAGADPTIPDNKGITPLQLATQRERQDYVELLRKYEPASQ